MKTLEYCNSLCFFIIKKIKNLSNHKIYSTPERIKKVSSKKLSSKKVKITFSKIKGAKKYVVQFSKTKKFKKALLTKTAKVK